MSDLRVYLDDSGNKEYGQATSRYFVYAGPVVSLEDERPIAGAFAAAKESAFGTAEVEIKSNWMRLPKERRRRYLEPYGLSEERFARFVDEWYELMAQPSITYIASVIDKPQMLERYGARAWHPSAAAYQFLLQRYELHLRRLGASGRVTIDDMSGSSAADNQWRDLLRTQHKRLKRDGCRLTKLAFDHVADSFLFGDSARFHLLQVADVAAYNVFRQFRSYGDEWDRLDGHHVTLYPWLSKILPRFARSSAGVLEGWGIVKWPSERTSRWRVDFDTP